MVIYEVHRGETLKRVIDKSGITYSQLAQATGISRNTLYQKFTQPELSIEFIKRVYKAYISLMPNFLDAFPELREELIKFEESLPIYAKKLPKEGAELERKYIKLLERHNQLLNFLVRMANSNEFHILKKEINKFMEEDSQ